jgi:uncharacterized protein (TIGR00369 family)
MRYGVASREETAGMTGKEMLQAIIDGRLPQPPICEALGYWIAEVGDGFAAFEGDPSPRVLNPAGTVHGGWALTMIDSATACAAQSLLPAGVYQTTIETKANFSRPVTAETGRVRCEARVASQGRQIISAEGRISNAAGKVLAHGTSTLMVLQPR